MGGTCTYSSLSWCRLSPADGGPTEASTQALPARGFGEMGQEGQPLQGVGSLTLQKGNLSEKARLRGLQKGPAQGEVLQTGGEGGSFISKCPLSCVTSCGACMHLCS